MLIVFLSSAGPVWAMVGTTPAQFNVSNSGAASYSIPIKLPPAVGGMAPNLSLNYSSQSGNGVMGKGWQVGGGSYITRCGTNFERDDYIDGVDFDLNDQWCLDGQRLIPVSGDNGAEGAEYRTEIDTYKKSYRIAIIPLKIILTDSRYGQKMAVLVNILQS